MLHSADFPQFVYITVVLCFYLVLMFKHAYSQMKKKDYSLAEHIPKSEPSTLH